jgi:hypothetical protein
VSSEAKVIRGQVRQVVKEILPEVLVEQAVREMEIRIMTYVKKRLDQIDERQKDIQTYMIRNK